MSTVDQSLPSIDLAKLVIAAFNREHTWEEVTLLCGGIQRDRFCAVWRHEAHPSVVIGEQGRGEYACDYGMGGAYPKKLDKYEVWCLANGIEKKKDLAERIAMYRKGQYPDQEKQTAMNMHMNMHEYEPIEPTPTYETETTDEQETAPVPFHEPGEAFTPEQAQQATVPSASPGSYPPLNRACYVCGKRVWVWNGSQYECASGDPAHEERRKQAWIWAKP
jgi:hypothetical protein